MLITQQIMKNIGTPKEISSIFFQSVYTAISHILNHVAFKSTEGSMKSNLKTE
jgi:hypothetical protein